MSMGRYSIVLIVLALAAVGGWYVWQGRTNLVLSADPLVAAQAANSEGLSPQAAAAAQASAAQEFPNTYTNNAYGFSFNYPSNLKIGEQRAPGGRAVTILAQDVVQHLGFQVYITPFADPDSVITEARVVASLPDVVVSDAHEARLGPSSPGLAFLTNDSAFGKSRQVWVVYQQHLYQISSYSSQDALLQKVLSTWIFTK